MCRNVFCTFRYIVRQRAYVIYDAIIYSKRPLLSLRHLPSNNELSTEKPHSVVDVDTVCLIKARLDKFWLHQDFKYDFTADLTGIGDRSVHEISGLQYCVIQ